MVGVWLERAERSVEKVEAMEVEGRRRVKSVDRYLHLFPRPTGKDIVIRKSANVNDTVRFIQEKAPKAKWQTEKFAQYIKGKDLDETCSNLWHWLYEHIPYKKDEDGVEQIRSPRRLVYEGSKTGVDCDCFSFTISCTLWCLKIPHKYRITKYPKLDGSIPRWQHIYIVVPKDGRLDYELDNKEDYIVLDCVKNAYDEEEPYLEYQDFDTLMRLDYLDGLDGEETYEVPRYTDARDLAAMYDEEDLGKIGQWLKKAAKNVGKAAGKAFKAVNKVNPVAFALRKAVLFGMKHNFMNVSKRLRYGYMSDEQAKRKGFHLPALPIVRKIKDKIEKIYVTAGGSKDALKLAVLQGKGNKDGTVSMAGLGELNALNIDPEEYKILNGTDEYDETNGLGIAPAAILAPAVAIFKTISGLLKKVKGILPKGHPAADHFDKEEDPEADASMQQAASNQPDATDSGYEETDNSTAPAPAARIAPQSLVAKKLPFPQTLKNNAASSQPAKTDQTQDDEKPGFLKKAKDFISDNKLLVGAVVVAGVGGYLAYKKFGYKGKSRASSELSGIPTKKKRRKNKPKAKKHHGRKAKVKFIDL